MFRREGIIFTVLSAIIIVLTVFQFNQINSVFGLAQLLLYLCFICTGIYAVYRLLNDKREIPLFAKVKPLLLGFLLVCSFFFLSFIINTDGGKKRVFTAGGNHGAGFINFQLFTDNTFKLLDASGVGGKIYRGTYSLLNDTLLLGNNELKFLYPTLKLVVKDGAGGVKYLEPVGGDILKNMLFIELNNRKTPLWDNFTAIR